MLISIVDSRIVTILKNRIVVLSFLLLLTLLPITGCDNALASKPTEIEARAILNELGQVRQSKHIRNPLPELYRQEPQRLNVKDGVKLFYFTKHHTVDKLSVLVTQQLGNNTSLNAPTNQLIVHCVDDAEADTVLGFLEHSDVPPIQINVDCLILERFGDETMDRETTIQIDNLLGEQITLGGKTDSSGNLLAAFPGASLRESTRSTFGLNIGYSSGLLGHRFRAVVDLLISRGYLKVLLNPTLETVNGKTATVTIKDFAPIEQTVTAAGVNPYSLTKYEWVEDKLTVTPSVFSDGSIGLKTDIIIGSRSKPEGVTQTSIITKRSINVEENRIEPGKSLVIGGMRKSEKRDVIRGVPFLKDIPIFGVLFSSKDYEEKATEIIFILTPSISSGSVDHAEVVEEIRKKHATIKYVPPGLDKIFSDPLGTGAYAEHIEGKALEAETQRVKAEIDLRNAILAKEQALTEAAEAEKQMAVALTETEKAKAETDAAKAAVDVAKAQAQIMQAAAEKARAEANTEKMAAQKARTTADAEKSAAQKAKAEAETAKTEVAAEKASATAEKVAAEQAKAEANVAKTASEQTKAEAETAKTASERTTAEAEAAKAAAQKAKAEADAAKAAAEKAKAEADAEKAKAAQQNQTPPPAQPEN
jgi:hypothetical protein